MDAHQSATNTDDSTANATPNSGSADKKLAELEGELSALKQHVKFQLSKKKEVSSQFKLAKGDKEKTQELKAKMQVVSAELASLEQERKSIEQAIATVKDSLLEGEPTRKTTPSQFSPITEVEPTAEISISLASDADIQSWDQYVGSHQQASAYHYYVWRQVISESFGHQSFYLIAKSGEEIVGVLPITWLSSKLFGSFGVSIPFFNYGGPLANSNGIAAQLLERASTIAKEHNLSHLEVRTTTDAFSWPAETKKVSMLLALPSSKETLDSDLGAKVRAQAKQADQYSPVIKFGGVELLDDFYHVFAINMRDLGTPVYGKQIFKNIITNASINAKIVVTYINNNPVGTAFLIGHRELMEIPWASTIKRVNHMNINSWMYHHILHYCIDQGFEFFDFGRSTVNAGTYRFKKQWGAKPIKHFWYTWRPEGEEAPSLNPDNPKFKLMIATWKRLPLFMANLIGPHVVKNLP